jgi:hypothetical protein
LFSVIGLPHGDDPAAFLIVDFGIGRPHHDHHSTVEQTDRNVARLRIREPFICECKTHSRKHLRRIEEIEAVLPQRFGSFLPIEGDLYARRIT